ncbi:MAG TPA: hypothetical protein VF647_22140 [Longimicrobium sp.]|jgi:hypothetical protein
MLHFDSSDGTVARGADVLAAMLRERTTDLRRVALDEFREWLLRQLPGWRLDPVFAQRERIRDLRRASPRLRVLERDRRRVARADADSPEGERLRQVEEELRGVASAVEGLTGALEDADEDRRASLREKLDAFRARRAALEAERDVRIAASPERVLLVRLDAELERLREESGVGAEEARLDEMMRAQGRRSGRAGGGFEAAALRAVREHILPELGDGPLTVLTGVTLGTARTELDQVVVCGSGDTPVEVLAVVEAKRNPNDVAHGFTRRQADLAWLSGQRAAYDPAQHVTRHFPTGHFDRAEHEQDGARFVFDPSSFHRFHPEDGHFLDGLYFVTRATPLAGLSGAALGRLRHRAATDERFAPADDAYLADLLAWCRTLTEPIETPDVLALYAAEPERARQILFLT